MIRSRVTLATIDAAAIAALFVSPSTTARCGGRERAEPEPVHEARLRSRGEIGEHGAEPPQVRAVQPVPVDVAGRDDPDRDVSRRVEHDAEEQLAHLGIDLLRVVQERQRPRPTAAAAPRSRTGRRRRRAGRRAIPGPPRPPLRRSGRRAGGRSGEAAVRSGSSSLEDIARPGTSSVVPTLVPVRRRSEGQDAAAVGPLEHDLPAGVLERRAVPVAPTVASPGGADEDVGLALDEPRVRVAGAASPASGRTSMQGADPRPPPAQPPGAAPRSRSPPGARRATSKSDDPGDAHAGHATARSRPVRTGAARGCAPSCRRDHGGSRASPG